jgi:DNA mismatch repair protein MutS
MKLYDDYARVYRKYRELYGDLVLVAYEVGSFYEWYNGGGDAATYAEGCDVKGVCDLLNVQLTRRSKNVPDVSPTNPLLGGVPKCSFPKYLPLLLENEYTVVIVSQFGTDPDITRRVTDVLSKGTCMADIPTASETNEFSFSSSSSTFLMSLYLDSHKAPRRNDARERVVVLHAGVALVDVNTGYTAAYEVSADEDDTSAALDELYRIVHEHAPREVVLFGVREALTTTTQNEREEEDEDEAKAKEKYRKDTDLTAFLKRLALNPRTVRDRLNGDDTKRLGSLKYQADIIAKAFPPTGFLSSIETLDLETKPHATSAFAGLLQFLYEHDETLVKDLRKPAVNDSSANTPTLTVGHNSAEQLELAARGNGMDSNGMDANGISLCGVLNACVTSMGRRYFRQQLLHPLVRAEHIDARLDEVCDLLGGNNRGDVKEPWETVRDALRKVVDLERLFRRMAIGKVEHRHFVALDASLEAILDGQYGGEANSALVGRCLQLARSIRSAYHDRLDVSVGVGVGGVASSHVNVFREGVFEDLDSLQRTVSERREDVLRVVDALNASQGSGFFRVESVSCRASSAYSSSSSSSSTSMCVVATPTRCSNLLKTSSKGKVLWHGTPHEFRFRDIEIRSMGKTTSCVHHPLLQEWFAGIVSGEERLREEVTLRFADLVREVWTTKRQDMTGLATAVSKLDYAATCARNARRRRHVRPKIEAESDDGVSYFDAKALRHPLLEALNQRVQQVPNDVRVGVSDSGGTLLYGMNAAGKSCLMKAVALAVVMAQAGMFVPAESLSLAPFRSVFTRIQPRDDISRGQSTFMCEMAEVRSILKRCDRHSLVIGDEVCSGTESVSAVSIVGACVRRLLDARVPFLFATHLHELPGIPELDPYLRDDKNSWRLRICHLRVRHDVATGRLVYDRKLCEGQGPTVYGLEVCKALDMDAEFVELAQRIRKGVLGLDARMGATRASHFNARVVMDVCGMCRARKAEEVHHIRHQVSADNRGYIDYFHKNVAFNLVPLCSACHDAVHSGSVEVEGFVQTSDGVELVTTNDRKDRKVDRVASVS